MKSFDEVLNGAIEFAKLTGSPQYVFRLRDGQYTTLGTDLAKLQSEGRTLLAEVEDDGSYQLLTIRGAVDSEPK